MKKKHNAFLRIMSVLFVIYLFLYFMVQSGYYESKLAKKTILTEKSIRQFEEDIKSGKTIDIDSYYVEDDIDYSSFASNLGKKTTIRLSKGLNVFFKKSGVVLKKLFW